MYTGSKVLEYPQNFTDKMWKILKVMHVIETDGVEPTAYKLKDIPNVWYDLWEEGRGKDVARAV